ncbi:MAG: lipoprotein [Candidatus Hydrogenedentota bacterium]
MCRPNTARLGLTFIFLAAPIAASAAGMEGHWEGVLTGKERSTPLAIDFEDSSGKLAGRFALPEFRWLDVPIQDIAVKRGKLSGAVGQSGKNLIEAEIRRDTIKGTYTYNGRTMPFELQRAPVPERPYTTEEVEFRNGDIKLAGVLYIPRTSGPHPAVVFLHGSGDNERWHYSTPADFFARLGVAGLCFDKRGNGKSEGDWRKVGFDALAEDGLAGLQMLRSRRDIDPKRVGFWGVSQAGWIMVLAASKSSDVAYFICVNGGASTVEREGFYDYEWDLARKGYSEEDIAEAVELLRRNNEITRGRGDYEAFLEYVQPLRDQAWYREIGFVPFRPDSPARSFYRLIVDFDPIPHLRKLTIPALFHYSEADETSPSVEDAARLRALKGELGKDWTIYTYPNANHGVRLPPSEGAAFPFQTYAPGYWENTAEWIERHGFR